jgi:hypothetical protein
MRRDVPQVDLARVLRFLMTIYAEDSVYDIFLWFSRVTCPVRFDQLLPLSGFELFKIQVPCHDTYNIV